MHRIKLLKLEGGPRSLALKNNSKPAWILLKLFGYGFQKIWIPNSVGKFSVSSCIRLLFRRTGYVIFVMLGFQAQVVCIWNWEQLMGVSVVHLEHRRTDRLTTLNIKSNVILLIPYFDSSSHLYLVEKFRESPSRPAHRTIENSVVLNFLSKVILEVEDYNLTTPLQCDTVLTM